MATFKACVQKMRADGFYPAYIRVTQDRKVAYIKTDKMVAKKNVSRSKEIQDSEVLKYCLRMIGEFSERLNLINTEGMNVREIVEFLQTRQEDVCFSDYARAQIGKMINTGHGKNAKNYRLALQSLEKFVGTHHIMVSYLTSAVLNGWIDSMMSRSRCKELYPVCMRQVFRFALNEFNDEEKQIERIKNNPWPRVKIPKSDKTEQRAISAEECREFFFRPLPRSRNVNSTQPSTAEIGRDVAMLVLCLGGMNTVDLYNLKKSDYHGGKICYNRAKTKNVRADGAYMEMRVEPFIQSVFEKYFAPDEDEYLFSFHTRYCDYDSFRANVNAGIRKICKWMGMTKEDYYCSYTFRHTWATIAQNDCGANLAEIGFGLNHSLGHHITRGYVKLDYTPAWTLNAKVIDFVFYSDKPSKQGLAREEDEPQVKKFSVTPADYVSGRAYYMGRVLSEVRGKGFANVDVVIDALVAKLSGNVPDNASVMFRLQDVDKGTEAVYERTKGKGF